MKKLLALILTLTLLLCCVPFGALNITANAATSGTTGDCTWSLNGTVLTISGNGKMGNYRYTSSPWGTSITEVIIQDGVTSIGNYAFEDCYALTSITIPHSVTSIGERAFYDCSKLTSITIPDSVTSIGERAFYNCSKLTSITIPDNVTSIGERAFYNCSSVKLFSVSQDNQNYSSASGVLFNKDKTILMYYPAAKPTTSYTIPDSVKSIGEWAFSSCSSLTSITIPDSVTSIGDEAFSYCSSLTSITIPDSVTSIGGFAFRGCSKLTSITIPDSVKSIGEWAFYDCSSLTSITIPDSVTSIGEGAFSYCSSLTSITIPDSVTSIGGFAFRGCLKLTNITIPDSVKSIGERAFEYCFDLKTVYYRGSETDESKIEIGSYNSYLTDATWYYNACIGLTEHTYDDENDLICNVCGFKIVEVHPYLTYTETENGAVVTGFKDGISDNVIIPETLNGAPVIAIENMAFVYCENIISVIIPNSVTDIKEYAFYGCSSLEKVTLGNGVKNIGTEAFADCTTLKVVDYAGSKYSKSRINFANGNEYLQNAEWQYGELFEPGDVNIDNEINVSDLATLKKYIAGLLTEAEMLTVNPDVDENAIVNVADLAQLKKMIAGLV